MVMYHMVALAIHNNVPALAVFKKYSCIFGMNQQFLH